MFANCYGLYRAMDAAVVGLNSFAFTLGKNKVCLDGCLHSIAYFSFRMSSRMANICVNSYFWSGEMELVLAVLVFYRFVLFYFGWMCNLCVFLLYAHLCWLASWWALYLQTMSPLSKI